MLSTLRSLVRAAFAIVHVPRVANIAWLLCWIVILFAGLWPWEPHPPNAVKWLQSEAGVTFYGEAEVYCVESLLEMIKGANHSSGRVFSLELLLRPREQERFGVDFIVLDGRANSNRELLLLRYGSTLILETRFQDGTHRQRKLGVHNVFVPGESVHIAVVSGAEGTKLYVNGNERGTDKYAIATDQLVGPFILGNSGRPNHSWQGDVLGLAVYDCSRTAREIRNDATAWKNRNPDTSGAVEIYTFSEKSGEWVYPASGRGVPLRIPTDLVILHRSMLAWDFSATSSGLWDMAENVTGFIPFGFFAAAVFARRRSLRSAALLAILVGSALSFSVEFTQAYLPLRDSSAVDLAMNALGSAAGAVLLVVTATAAQGDVPRVPGSNVMGVSRAS